MLKKQDHCESCFYHYEVLTSEMLAAIDIAVLCNSETNTDASEFRIQYCIPVSFRCHKIVHAQGHRIIPDPSEKSCSGNVFATRNSLRCNPYAFGKFCYFRPGRVPEICC